MRFTGFNFKFCPWNNLDKYQAGFKLPLDREKFKEKLIFFHQMNSSDYKKFNLGEKFILKNI